MLSYGFWAMCYPHTWSSEVGDFLLKESGVLFSMFFYVGIAHNWSHWIFYAWNSHVSVCKNDHNCSVVWFFNLFLSVITWNFERMWQLIKPSCDELETKKQRINCDYIFGRDYTEVREGKPTMNRLQVWKIKHPQLSLLSFVSLCL